MPPETPKPPIVDPLTVEIVDGHVVLDGNPDVIVALSRDAAVETGVRLINAGLGIEDEPDDK